MTQGRRHGRKGRAFCGSDNGGRTAAVLYSLIATCQCHRLDPFAYLRAVLSRLLATPHGRPGALLPDRWRLASAAADPAAA